jgi:hypothetical protein
LNDQNLTGAVIMTRKSWIGFCVLSVFLFFSSSALAGLVLADGGPTGQWWNPARDGEGFFVEIIDSGSSNQIGIAMYTFDADGAPLWIVGNAAIGPNDEIVDIPVFEFNGPSWGPAYDPGDLNRIPFGTITVNFPTCDTALFSVQSDGSLPSGDYSLVRITSVEGVGCTEPPDPPPAGITAGEWTGTQVCFMVSEDGTSIIGGNLSDCDAQAAFDSNLDGISNELNECKVTTSCEGVWPIVDGKFTCLNELGELAFGTFTSNTSASGSAFEGEGGKGEFCSAKWTATPD